MAETPDESEEPRPGASRISTSRAIVLVVGMFLIGLLLLQADSHSAGTSLTSSTGQPSTTSTSTAPKSTSSTPAHATSSTTTTSTAPKSTSSTLAHATSSTTSTSTAPTATSGTVPPAQVNVLVANGSGVNGAGDALTTTLEGDGWNMFAAVTATSQVSSTTVYYATGEQAEAEVVAGQIKAPSSAVQALTTSVPVADPGGAAVVIVLGPDLAPAPSSTAAAS